MTIREYMRILNSDAPVEMDEKYLNTVLDEISELLQSATRSANSVSGSAQGIEEAADEAYGGIYLWAVMRVLKEPGQWHLNVRFLNALRVGLWRKIIVINSSYDIDLFRFLFTMKLPSIPQVVEYYVETGEIMEVMSILKHCFNGALEKGESKETMIRSRALQLYTYDVRSEQESAAKGEEHPQLPLDIRFNFSDLYSEEAVGEE